MRKKSKRFYVVCVWNGEDVLLNTETGRVAFDGIRRLVTRKVAEGLCAALMAKNGHAIGKCYLDGYEVREEMSYPGNPNCDGSHCRSVTGEVRVLPTGGDSNAILCRVCYHHELKWRRERNRKLEDWAKFDLPGWDTLEVYK